MNRPPMPEALRQQIYGRLQPAARPDAKMPPGQCILFMLTASTGLWLIIGLLAWAIA